MYVTMILIQCDYPCEKAVSDNVYSGKVPDSANGSSQNNAGYYPIHCQDLGLPAWKSHYKEQSLNPTH